MDDSARKTDLAPPRPDETSGLARAPEVVPGPAEADAGFAPEPLAPPFPPDGPAPAPHAAPHPQPSVADAIHALHQVAAAPAESPQHPTPSVEAPVPEVSGPSVADVLAELHRERRAAEALEAAQPVTTGVLVPVGEVGFERPRLRSPSALIPTIAPAVPTRRTIEPRRLAPPPPQKALPPPQAELPEVPVPLEPSSAEPPAPAVAEPETPPESYTARVVPFAPRAPRPSPPPLTPEQLYAKPAVPFFSRTSEHKEAWTPAPAQPPPPDGYRRIPDGAALAGGAPGRAEALPGPRELHPGAALRRWLAGVSWWRMARSAARIAATLLLAYATLVLVLVVAYRWVDPPLSNLMLSQRLSGTAVTQRWVPLERIAPTLQQAVILAEDGQFCRHRGVDWGELKDAIEHSLEGSVRGGSTISMQLVKNLFLWSSKSYVRKVIEIPLALLVEMVWPKSRVLEIYLNIAEWGPGIFGAEAAARYHFGKPAANLSLREASLLAVSLPNPFDRQAGRPGAGTQRLADNLQARLRRAGNVASCGRVPKGRVGGTPGAAERRWP